MYRIKHPSWDYDQFQHTLSSAEFDSFRASQKMKHDSELIQDRDIPNTHGTKLALPFAISSQAKYSTACYHRSENADPELNSTSLGVLLQPLPPHPPPVIRVHSPSDALIYPTCQHSVLSIPSPVSERSAHPKQPEGLAILQDKRARRCPSSR